MPLSSEVVVLTCEPNLRLRNGAFHGLLGTPNEGFYAQGEAGGTGAAWYLASP